MLRPLALALAAVLVSAPARAQVADPVPGPIPLGALTADVEVVAVLPDSGPAARPRARPMLLSGDGSGRRFVVDQNGVLYQIHPDGSLSVFLDVAAATALTANQRQRGVSSFAFHPDFHVAGAPGEGRLYTASSQDRTSGTPDYPVPAGAATIDHSVIHEWQVDPNDPDAIDPASAREVLRVGQPYTDHNVGWIGFDPTRAPGDPDRGLLYIAFGDGGNTGCCPFPVVDPHQTAQDLSHPLGSMLRIDPLAQPGGAAYGIPAGNPFAQDGDPATLGEIWAYGLRNPHTFSWDAGGTDRLLIADIGQASVEEVNLGAAGANYGWSEREGRYLVQHTDSENVYPLPPGDALLGFTYPVLQYDHDEGDRAVSGGFVLRAPGMGPLEGRYVFGDLVTGRVFHTPVSALDGSGPAAFEELRLVDAADGQQKSLLQMVGGGPPAARADLRFGRDDAGAVYLLTKGDGTVRRLLPSPACRNGVDDDGDGATDYPADPGCADAASFSEAPACQDGLDNDGDGTIDFDGGAAAGLPPAQQTAPDAFCTAPTQLRERPRSRCGLGAELAFTLLGLAGLRRRRLRTRG